MLKMNRLLGAAATEIEPLRYGPRRAAARRPAVAWTTTRRCNLHCMDTYADSYDRPIGSERSTDARSMLLDLST